MQNANSATSLELEWSTGLHQPEVSITMKQLKEWDRVRPYKVYSLKIAFNDIIALFEKQQRKTVEEAQARIERFKELGK